MKVSELTGPALNWAVAKCEGKKCLYSYVEYSTDWTQGGAIIERELIGLSYAGRTWWAMVGDSTMSYSGETPLIAAMRGYVAAKLGDNIQIPEELTK